MANQIKKDVYRLRIGKSVGLPLYRRDVKKNLKRTYPKLWSLDPEMGQKGQACLDP